MLVLYFDSDDTKRLHFHVWITKTHFALVPAGGILFQSQQELGAVLVECSGASVVANVYISTSVWHP